MHGPLRLMSRFCVDVPVYRRTDRVEAAEGGIVRVASCTV